MAEKKKCQECGAPLEGFLFSTVGKLFGIKESDTEGICNKCKDDVEKTNLAPEEVSEEKEISKEDDSEEEDEENGEDNS
ncbi:hypothetical protein HOD83_01520 [Candidatus Woesearchaeota archaeon]|jgi:hypothetical protein|nr:hypothetical protein [Candidatus Woesearchaeota archaeon]MBT4114583.1 hypothetical protein [Candidatus Woesearchaeota archaeon]MBT4248250.1 hypothetical protein [Candidatus Woesearchaeota archaeon]